MYNKIYNRFIRLEITFARASSLRWVEETERVEIVFSRGREEQTDAKGRGGLDDPTLLIASS
jgi:hypothetical protein